METLHEDLIQYAYGGMIDHPIIKETLTTDVSRINRMYREKITMLKKAESCEDWSKYVFLYERPYRLNGLLDATKKGLKHKASEFWALVGSVWNDSENIHQNLSKWKRVWGAPIDGRRACMSDEDLCTFDSLPAQIEVWRGTSHIRGLAGLSWTLDQAKAVSFARRFCSKSRVPLLAKGVADRADVLAYFGERDESEIVSMRVLTISETDLSR